MFTANNLEIKIKTLYDKCQAAKVASKQLVKASTEQKNKAILAIAQALRKNKEAILAANNEDMQKAKEGGMSEALLDRLLLTDTRIESMAKDTETVSKLTDPVGEIFEEKTLPNGLILARKRVPLGVIASIYESRPNVTIDVSVLCLKAGNATILRGGKEALNSNKILADLAIKAVQEINLPQASITFIDDTDRALVPELLHMNNLIDLVIPRGNAALINLVKSSSTIPVVAGGIGVCNIYVDKSADVDMAVRICYNARVQRPTVCNSMDCLLIHKDLLQSHLVLIAQKWNEAGVEIRADKKALETLQKIGGLKLKKAGEQDYGTEFLALIAAVKTVDSLDEALTHIEKYGSGHSEAIITKNEENAERFLNEVDAAAVYVNASTRFTDGAQFGLGAELGISTQKMHARGPLGLKEITSYKWIIRGQGQERP
ncbi:MAG: glutamate-5-semialdehyde dehydrogenase [Chloroflexi bacterium]|nr:glutamate-5-semialdehyde dehydrogenase [Chloroflexota bacterium]